MDYCVGFYGLFKCSCSVDVDVDVDLDVDVSVSVGYVDWVYCNGMISGIFLMKVFMTD